MSLLVLVLSCIVLAMLFNFLRRKPLFGNRIPAIIKTLKEKLKPPPYDGPACPFYGFVGVGFAFMENNGNACALTGQHSPCKMEMNHEKPEWCKCTAYNTSDNAQELSNMMNVVYIAPKVLSPKGTNGWKGVKLKKWFSYVMGQKFHKTQTADDLE